MENGISRAILDSLRDQLCLIDPSGKIIFVNQAWINAALNNGGDLESCGIGANYLEVCKEEEEIHTGISSVLSRESDYFANEYPCHTPDTQRWFYMQVAPLYTNDQGMKGAVIWHVDITEKKLLENKLKMYAVTDPLTSLYNRRFFDQKLKKEMLRAKRRKRLMSILLVDIDHFKEINDTFGHSIGDHALRELSFLMLEVTKECGICARLGGDEFAILLPERNASDLSIIAETLLNRIRRLTIRAGKETLHISVSIGGTSFKGDMNKKQVVETADEALYTAKRRGKNQVVIVDLNS
ncbi:sensor domain-containing diguanylate cyclase [Paenibacillus chungangensis]|uniref:Diguanylate cyclase n=1 Tax=Paenibacillus chungangensis TaxID=696535 RepID=A0ABW3HRJ6_9BACL